MVCPKAGGFPLRRAIIAWVVGTTIYGRILAIFMRIEAVILYACWCHTNAFAVTVKKRFINRCPRWQLMVCPMIVGHIHVMAITGTYCNSVIGSIDILQCHWIYPMSNIDVCRSELKQLAGHSSGTVARFLIYDCRVSCLLGMWTKSHVFFSALVAKKPCVFFCDF